MPCPSLKREKEVYPPSPRLKGGWPIRLAMCESAIRWQDERMFKKSPMFVDLVVSATIRKVRLHQVEDVVEELKKRGCPERELLYLLGMCENRGVGNSFSMIGFDPERWQTQMRRIRSAANKIERINGKDVREGWGGTEFGKFLEFAEAKRSKPSIIAEFLRLPNILREYLSLAEHATKYLGGKSDFYLGIAKARLVRFVRLHTGRYHHGRVATLLSVILRPEYGQIEHIVWFSLYQQRLQHYCPDRKDSAAVRAKKTLLECEAAIFYRMDVLHPGSKSIKQRRRTSVRSSDLH
jgi:hypothetical protein